MSLEIIHIGAEHEVTGSCHLLRANRSQHHDRLRHCPSGRHIYSNRTECPCQPHRGDIFVESCGMFCVLQTWRPCRASDRLGVLRSANMATLRASDWLGDLRSTNMAALWAFILWLKWRLSYRDNSRKQLRLNVQTRPSLIHKIKQQSRNTVGQRPVGPPYL